MKFNTELVQFAEKFGEFFLRKNGEDQEKAGYEILCLRIVDLSINNGKLVVKLHNPGRLIGIKGQQIEEIEKYVGMPIHIEEIHTSIVDCIFHGLSRAAEEQEAFEDDYPNEYPHTEEECHDWWRE